MCCTHLVSDVENGGVVAMGSTVEEDNAMYTSCF